METNFKIAADPSLIGHSTKRLKERFFILNHFKNFIYKSANNQNSCILRSDYSTHIMNQVFEYTKGLFTLPQLYCMFMANKHNGTGWDYQRLNEYKIEVLKCIDLESSTEHDLGDIGNFKRKIMELNPIIFNVLNDLIFASHLFWDDEKKEFRYPLVDVKSVETIQ
jgi:hypothetical protein